MTEPTGANLPRARRLASIDMLRGLVMVIMTFDHVRDMVTQRQPAMDFSHAFTGSTAALITNTILSGQAVLSMPTSTRDLGKW